MEVSPAVLKPAPAGVGVHVPARDAAALIAAEFLDGDEDVLAAARIRIDDRLAAKPSDRPIQGLELRRPDREAGGGIVVPTERGLNLQRQPRLVAIVLLDLAYDPGLKIG